MVSERHSLFTATRPLCDIYDLLMLDLDGVVYIGADAVAGASASLHKARACGPRLAYVTNNASRTPGQVADRLRQLDIPVEADGDVVTSAQAAARLVADLVRPGAEVLVVGGEGLYAALAERGLRGVDRMSNETAAVVQGFHPDVDWPLLAEGAFGVRAGLPWVASNTDMTFPTARGPAPGNGSLVQAVSNATGEAPIVAGKPQVALFRETQERVGGSRPLVIGDRLDTDIEGANKFGADSLAVLTGVTTLSELAGASPLHRPTYVAADLRGLFEPHDEVVVDGDDARCAQAVATIRAGRIDMADASRGRTTSALRAALTLAWAYRDETGQSAEILVESPG